MREQEIPHFPKKKQVVLRLKKDGLPVVSLVVDVIGGVRLEVHGEGVWLFTYSPGDFESPGEYVR
jgi:hypothetical protein